LITYAQNFEDVMLERLFSETKRGFYIDIGAWDPRDYSVTRHFYERGWRGLNVEPIASRHAKFVTDRPRDINVHSLVGGHNRPTRFFECVEEDYLSTTVAAVAEEMKANGLTVSEYEVEVERLDALIDRHCPKVIDFLKLDVEGAEADVLKTIDLQRFRPRALVIESTIPGAGLKSWDEPDAFGCWDKWEEDVLRQGYIFARFDGLNRFYVRSEDERLAHRLSLPPGIFDGIDPSHLPQAEADARLEVIKRQQTEIISLSERSEAAEGWMAQHEQHRIAAQAKIETLTGERKQLERAFKALESVKAPRETELCVLRDESAALARQLSDANQAIKVFEEWFDRLQATPLNALTTDIDSLVMGPAKNGATVTLDPNGMPVSR
jgi:FkbM family methyltransferase